MGDFMTNKPVALHFDLSYWIQITVKNVILRQKVPS